MNKYLYLVICLLRSPLSRALPILAMALFMVTNLYGQVQIRQKQNGTVDLTGSTTSVPISTVDEQYSILLFSVAVDNNEPDEVLVGGFLTGNQLTFTRNTAGATATINWQVIEFTASSGITVQRSSGFIDSDSDPDGLGARNFEINSVNTANAFPIVSYHNNGSTFGNDDFIRATLTNSTTLRLDAGGGDVQAAWQVVECSSCTVQAATATIGNSNTTATSTITAVDMAKTLLFTSLQVSGNVNGDDLPRTELTNSTTVTHTRTGNTTNVELTTYVVEFDAADPVTVQHGTLNFPDMQGTQTASITAVDELASIIMSSGGYGRYGSGGIDTDDNPGANSFTFALDNTNTVSATRTNTSNIADVSYQVAEFDVDAMQTWYVFLDGNFNDATRWTLDASTAPLYDNPGGEIPGAGDRVIIYPGKNITMDIDNVTIDFIEVRGNLNLANTTGHNFNNINGSGIIRTQGHDPGGGLIDNFPEGITNGSIGFGHPANGGTLVIEGAGTITFSNAMNDANNRPLRNLRLSRANSTDKTILAADFKFNGEIDIQTGDLQINDNTNTTPLLIDVLEDVRVRANGRMSVGTANAFTNLAGGTYGDYHRSFNTLQVGGDFTNQGSVRFTNQTQPAYDAYAPDGAVSLVFNRTSNARLNCQGTTDLYNLVLDKGTDPTYELEVFADIREHFSLFGRNNLGNNASGGNANHPEQQKALYIANGTMRFTGQVYIPTLTEGGRDYEIGERATMVLDGTDVFIQQTANNSTNFAPTPALSYNAPTGVNNGAGSQSFTLFGRVRIEDGLFRVGEPDNNVSLLFRSASPGVVEVNGGTFEAQQFTFSDTAPTDGVYSVVINGGVLRLWGTNPLRGGQATFHLPFENNVFTMTGGTLEILQATGTGAMVINASSNNINVTGGTVRLVKGNENNNRFRFTSRAPFYDLVIRNDRANANANARHFVEAITDDAPNAVPAYDLKVLNDLTLEAGATRTTTIGGNPNVYSTYLDLCPGGNCANLEVGRNLTIEDSAVLDIFSGNADNAGSATVTFNGTQNATLTIGDITSYQASLTGFIDPEGEAPYQDWEHPFYNLTVDKPGATLTLATTGTAYDAGNNTDISDGAGNKNINDFRNNLVKVANNFILERGTIDIDLYSVRLYGNITNKGIFGVDAVPVNAQVKTRRENTASVRTVTTTDGAEFGNLRLNSGAGIIAFTSDVYVRRLLYKHGRIDIGTHNLRVDNLVYSFNGGEVVGNDFSIEDMIIMDGNASDGGLSLYVGARDNPGVAGHGTSDPEAQAVTSFNGSNVYVFPIGTGSTGTYPGSRYTPANIQIENFFDDGYITINAVVGQLQTTGPHPLGNDVLNRYWRVRHEGFTTPPTITRYRFHATIADIPDGVNDTEMNGTSGTWRPGYVRDGGTYARTAEENATGTSRFDTNTADQNDNDPNAANEAVRILFFGEVNGSGTGPTPFTLINANYTAGLAAKFAGQPTVYYNRRGAVRQWSQNTSWYDAPTGTNNPAGTPQAGDIVVIRGTNFQTGIQVNGNRAAAEIIFEREGTYNDVEDIPRLFLLPTDVLNVGTIKGEGELYLQVSTSNAASVNADIGEYAANDRSVVIYYMTQNGTYNVSAADLFPNFPILRIYGQLQNYQRTAIFNYDFTAKQLLVDGQSVLRVGGNYTVENRTRLGYTGGGRIEFPNGATSYRLKTGEFVTGRAKNNPGDNDFQLTVQTGGGNGVDHFFEVVRNVELNFADASDEGTCTIDLFSNLNDNNVTLTLSGTGTHAFNDNYSAANSSIELYKIQMNKGTNLSNTFTFNDAFDIPDATVSFQPVEIVNGLLVLNAQANPAATTSGVLVANGFNFSLPNLNNPAASSGSGGLEVRQGTVRIEGDDTGILLDGLLRVSGGTLDMDTDQDNFIQYSTTGNAVIEVSGGSLEVGGQVRRATTTQEGVLTYTQTGGDATFGANINTPITNRGVFEILNAGSSFTYNDTDAASTFSIVADNTSQTVATLRLTPETHDIADGQIIQIGTANTPAGQDDMGVHTSIPLETLRVGETDHPDNPTVKLYSLPLTIDQLDISNGASVFDANGFDVTIIEGLSNEGIYRTSGSDFDDQITYFPSSGTTTISGTGTTTFWNLDKNGSGRLELEKDATVEDNAFIRQGILDTNDAGLFLEGDLLHDATHVSTLQGDATIEDGIIFNGTQQQLLDRSEAGESTFGMLRINNSSGVEIQDSEENFLITQKLTLETGRLDIGGNLLIFPVNSYIENGVGGIGRNDFNLNRMIQTNSSIRDFGVRKFYETTTDGLSTFTYPIGLTEYTPVVFNRGTNNLDGHITIRPVSDLPPIAEDAENDGSPCNDGVEIVDADNVLRYYWIVRSAGITNLNGDFSMYYDQSDVQTASPSYDETNYGAARLYNTETFWDKNPNVNSVDESNNIINFDFAGNDDANLEGIYTAGVIQDGSGNIICGAIPDQVPQYVTFTSGINSFFDNGSYDGSPAPPPSTAVDVIVRTGYTLQLDQSNIRTRKITIEEGATLEVQTGVNNINLGFIEGLGTLKLVVDGSDVMSFPTGDYSSFFPDASCSPGGGLEYSGTASYSVLQDIPVLRNVIFSGDGTRTFPNNHTLKICEDMDMEGTVDVIIPDGLNTITVLGNVNKSDNSTFDNGGGNSGLVMAGTSAQFIRGDFTGANSLNQLEINNAAGISIINDGSIAGISANQSVDVTDELILTNGLIDTDENNTLRLMNDATVSGYSSTSYVNGPLVRRLPDINNTFPFPVGNGGRYGLLEIIDPDVNTFRDWTVAYFNASPSTNADISSETALATSAIDEGIQRSSGNEYWSIDVSSTGGTNSDIRLRWDPNSVVESTPSNLRVVFWDGPSGTAWEYLNTDPVASADVNNGFLRAGPLSYSLKYVTLSTIDEDVTPLPVEMLYLRGRESDGMVELAWATASEIDNHFFEVQRSQDGKEWKVIGYVDGNGTTNMKQSYEFLDPNPFVGLSYYRLRQVDFDGQYEHTDIISVMLRLDDFSYTIYPNPVREIFTIEVRGVNAYEDLDFKIINLNGSILEKGIIGADDSGRVSKEMNVSQLIPGFYILIFESSDRAFKFNLLKK